ncbi:MAG: sigma-70 family RNA polymerase sigma factor [Prevotella sp.]|nr:sigma-70 family RNA polymerase sigma factor [Prevotella sp.]
MTDRELANKVIRDNDQRCFAEIVRRYSGIVFSKTLSVVRREELAKEVTQQTFIRAYERLACWRNDSLGPWLTTIAMHTALDELERERRNRPTVLSAMEKTVKDNASSQDYDAEHENRLQSMEKAIAALPEQDRQIIRLHYYQRVKTDEIARLTGLSQTNVLVRLHRIRDKLRKMLTPVNV